MRIYTIHRGDINSTTWDLILNHFFGHATITTTNTTLQIDLTEFGDKDYKNMVRYLDHMVRNGNAPDHTDGDAPIHEFEHLSDADNYVETDN
jgi:hypothetical protein